MSEQKHTPEPFGYFKADPFGWTDCEETDGCAIPLYDESAIVLLSAQRDEAKLHGANLRQRLAHMTDDAAGLRVKLREAEKRRDELLAALEQFVTWGRMQHKAQSKGGHATFDMLSLRDEIGLAELAIASVKPTTP